MNNIDQILIFLASNSSPAFEGYLSRRDSQVLHSLAKIVASPSFVTENQAKLAIKILKENLEKIPVLQNDIALALASPVWSKSFRQVTSVKTLSIITNTLGEKQILISFTFSNAVRKVLQELAKSITNFTTANNGKEYYADLTEKNIVLLVDKLTSHDFIVDEQLQQFYDTIKSWSKTEVEGQFYLTNISHQNFQKNITADLGLETAINKTVIIDRSIRYQYFYEKPENPPENLVEKIAYRTTPRVWIDKNTYSVEQVIESVLALRRLPLLVVFDSHNTKSCYSDLSILTESLQNVGIYDKVGIYFRLSNDTAGKEFNQFIADKQLNCQLDTTTAVVGVQSGKIPKFLLNTSWKPMSVLSIGNQLRHSKTAIYANCCDLIMTYTETEPIIETRMQWE
jgi:hypothetical protein